MSLDFSKLHLFVGKTFFLIKCEVITFNLLTFFRRVIFKLVTTNSRVFLIKQALELSLDLFLELSHELAS